MQKLCFLLIALLAAAGFCPGNLLRAAADGNVINNIEDVGFDEMESEAVGDFEANSSIKEDAMMDDEAPSALDNELSDEMAPKDIPDKTPPRQTHAKPAKGKAGAAKVAPSPASDINAAAGTTAVNETAGDNAIINAVSAPGATAGSALNATAASAAKAPARPAVAPVQPSSAGSQATIPTAAPTVASPASQAAVPPAQPIAPTPAASPGAAAAAATAASAGMSATTPASAAAAPPAPPNAQGAAWQAAPKEAPAALPTMPAAHVPQISNAEPVENAAVAPTPVIESETPAPASPVAPPAAASTVSSPAPMPTAETEGDPAMENAVSPEPDTGPTPTEAMLANEFAGAPPFPGARRIMADGEAPEEYDVETGDTLYDVCDQLIDDPAYWPKLWALNPEIANPHFIYPGMKLHFYPGDKDTPPFLQVVNEDDVVPVDKEALSEKQLVHDDVSDLLWKPHYVTDEKVNQDSDLAPDVIGPNDLAGIDVSQDFEAWGDVFRPSSYLLTVPAFIYEDEPKELGVVQAGTGGETLVGTHVELVIQTEDGGISPGATYTVLRRVGSIDRPSDNSFLGYRYDFIGNVVIENKIEESFVGLVKDQRLGIEPGDIVVPYVSTSRRIPMVGNAPSGGNGNEIVGFEYATSGMGGRGSYVLFDRSAGDLSVGQSVLVYQSVRRFEHRFLDGPLPNLKKAVAKVRIIDASSKAIVGYVESDFHEIYIGDRAGAGAGPG